MPISKTENGMRKCGDCGISHPATVEFFHRDKTGADGLRCYCKPCQRARAAACPTGSGESHNKNQRKLRRKWKMMALVAYGGNPE